MREQTKYRIVRLLGRGGMGSVYEVHHQRMDRRQALKVINPELVDNPQALLRFEQEVKAVAKLDHPNIARAYDAESFGSLQTIIMELVPGQTLHALPQEARAAERERRLPLRAAGLPGSATCPRAGTRASRPQAAEPDAGTQESGVVKILDFGLAKVVSENRASHGLTKTNMTMGTYEYSAPEQAIDAASADIRADIYSLGCTLYYLIAGVLPFDYKSDAKLLLAHQNEAPRPLGEVCPETPRELSDLVARMLAKSPADRPQTPGEVAKALLPFAKGETAARRRLPAASPHRTGRDGRVVQALLAPLSLRERRQAGEGLTVFASHRCQSAIPARFRTRGWLVAAGGAALAAIVLFGVLFTMRTPEGTLVVEISDPEATLQVLDAQGEVLIEQKAGAEKVEISVVPGKGKLRVVKNGVELLTKEFSLVSGGRETINARLEAPAAGQISDLRSQIPDPESEISDCRSQIANFKSPIPNSPHRHRPLRCQASQGASRGRKIGGESSAKAAPAQTRLWRVDAAAPAAGPSPRMGRIERLRPLFQSRP